LISVYVIFFLIGLFKTLRFVLDQVSEYMVKVVRDIDAGASVRDAAKKLDSLGIGSLLVKKDGDYVGMVSETEITRQSVAKNLDPNNTKISDILNPDIDYNDQEETMSRAIAIMREKRLRYLIVRDGKTVAGILSVKDLLAYYEKWFQLIL
jgi:signal-transduction protein with cAMP-binding, CBS, and nucleotidyltransferase domain